MDIGHAGLPREVQGLLLHVAAARLGDAPCLQGSCCWVEAAGPRDPTLPSSPGLITGSILILKLKFMVYSELGVEDPANSPISTLPINRARDRIRRTSQVDERR